MESTSGLLDALYSSSYNVRQGKIYPLVLNFLRHRNQQDLCTYCVCVFSKYYMEEYKGHIHSFHPKINTIIILVIMFLRHLSLSLSPYINKCIHTHSHMFVFVHRWNHSICLVFINRHFSLPSPHLLQHKHPVPTFVILTALDMTSNFFHGHILIFS